MHAPFAALAATTAVAALALAAGPGAGQVTTDRTRTVPAARAAAGVGGPWVTLAPANLGITQPDVIRDGNRLVVTWSRYDGSERSVRARLLTLGARLASSTRPVVTGWLAVIDDPKLVRHDGDLVSVFAGIRSSSPGDPYVGPAVHSSSDHGLGWDLEPGSLSQTTAAGNAQSIDVVNARGEPLFAMGGFGQHVIMHRGISASSPASTPDFFTTDSDCCPATFVSLANDARTRQTWAAWFALGASDPADAGVFAQKVWPRPNGALHHAPGTAAGGGSLNPGLPVALASRTGGGVWAAYSVGSPIARTIRLWQVGTNRRVDIRAGQFSVLALAAAPGGRLWVMWHPLSNDTIRATRSNRAATRFGPIRTIRIPGGSGGQLNTVSLEGSAGPLVIVAASQPPGSGSNGLYATRVLPKLSLSLSKGRISKGRVTATVRDAGDAVQAARVTFHGRTFTTNARGKVTFRVAPGVPDGRYVVAAAKPGYAKDTAGLRVT